MPKSPKKRKNREKSTYHLQVGNFSVQEKESLQKFLLKHDAVILTGRISYCLVNPPGYDVSGISVHVIPLLLGYLGKIRHDAFVALVKDWLDRRRNRKFMTVTVFGPDGRVAKLVKKAVE